MILKGNGVSPGIAIGKCYVFTPFVCDVPESYTEKGTEQQHLQHLRQAMEKSVQELDAIIASFKPHEADKGKIFSAHKEILMDEEIYAMAEQAIVKENKMPDYAVVCVFEEFINLLEAVQDAAMAQRVADFIDVRNRLVRVLHGEEERNLGFFPEPVIVVAKELLPSHTAGLDREKVLAIITETGSETSHSAIIANSFGIPAVLGVPDCASVLPQDAEIGLDALQGEIYCALTAQTRLELQARREEWLCKLAQENEFAGKEAILADGTKMQIGINIGSAAGEDGLENADFIGLFRTEFLYMENSRLPTEEEQYNAYKNVVLQAKGKVVTLRTLDIGGDKTLSYLPLPKEENPFLGVRALRLCFAKPELLLTQLRAALRAGAHGPLYIMFPMVGSVEELRKAKGYYQTAQSQLEKEQIPYGKNCKLGIMIEVPSIALMAELAAQEVDFASVGTNDLCQYLCAADRMHPGLTDYYQMYSPTMVRLLGQIAEAFTGQGKEISVCGEMAGTAQGAILLAGLGFKKISMSGTKIAGVKAALSKINLAQAEELAGKAKKMKTQQEIADLYQLYLT